MHTNELTLDDLDRMISEGVIESYEVKGDWTYVRLIEPIDFIPLVFTCTPTGISFSELLEAS
jgi:hypothetical protein